MKATLEMVLTFEYDKKTENCLKKNYAEHGDPEDVLYEEWQEQDYPISDDLLLDCGEEGHDHEINVDLRLKGFPAPND